MKTHFSPIVTPPPPPKKKKKNVAKRFVDVYLFPTLEKGEGEATFERGERGETTAKEKKIVNFQVSQQLWIMIVGS